MIKSKYHYIFSSPVTKAFILASSMLFAAGGAYASNAGDIERGKELAGTCAACHGMDGQSQLDMYPNIGGQNERYLYESIIMYQGSDPSKSRNNAIMAGMVANLSEQDVRDLAAYYASQPPSQGIADENLIELGQKIYQGGNVERGVPACMACHGPSGNGNSLAGYPRLAGQWPAYTAQAIVEYQNGERKGVNAQIMTGAVKNLTDEEIAAVSSYVAGLR